MNNPTIEIDIAEVLKKLEEGQKTLLEKVNNLEKGQVEIKGEIKSLDIKVDQLDKRVANQEFLNRGIFTGMLLIVIGAISKLFLGWTPNT